MARVDVIVNAGGGSFVEGETEGVLKEAFSTAGVDASFVFATGGDEIGSAAEKAASNSADTLVAGGGDGTVGLVAALAAKAGKTLGVLPLGTLNHFSKDLNIPDDIYDAAKVIAAGEPRRVDLAEVNGRIFINNSSIGLYPRIVRNREVQQERLGRSKWSAALIAALRVFRIYPNFRVKFCLDGREFYRKTPFVFVGNNEYEMDLYNIGRRQKLDGGKLSVYVLQQRGRFGIVLLLVKTLAGRLKQASEFEMLEADEITIDLKKQRVLVALDGEVAVLETPLNYRIKPGALTVLAPTPEEAANA